MKIEVGNRIVKKLFQRHELIKIWIPSGRVVHSVSPLVVFDGIEFSRQGNVGSVENVDYSLIRKDLSLASGAKHIEPVEGACKSVKQPGKPFR